MTVQCIECMNGNEKAVGFYKGTSYCAKHYKKVVEAEETFRRELQARHEKEMQRIEEGHTERMATMDQDHRRFTRRLFLFWFVFMVMIILVNLVNRFN